MRGTCLSGAASTSTGSKSRKRDHAPGSAREGNAGRNCRFASAARARETAAVTTESAAVSSRGDGTMSRGRCNRSVSSLVSPMSCQRKEIGEADVQGSAAPKPEPVHRVRWLFRAAPIAKRRSFQLDFLPRNIPSHTNRCNSPAHKSGIHALCTRDRSRTGRSADGQVSCGDRRGHHPAPGTPGAWQVTG
jgi:hypothetical protein